MRTVLNLCRLPPPLQTARLFLGQPLAQSLPLDRILRPCQFVPCGESHGMEELLTRTGAIVAHVTDLGEGLSLLSPIELQIVALEHVNPDHAVLYAAGASV